MKARFPRVIKNPMSLHNRSTPVQMLAALGLYCSLEKNNAPCKIAKGIPSFQRKAHFILQSEEGVVLLSQASAFFCSIYCSDLVALIPGGSSESPVKLRNKNTDAFVPCPTSTLIYLGCGAVQTLVDFIFLFCCFVSKISDGFSICLKLRNFVQPHIAGLYASALLERHLVVLSGLTCAPYCLHIACPCRPDLISMSLRVSRNTPCLP